jgi:selenocysteine-specific elongation factor
LRVVTITKYNRINQEFLISMEKSVPAPAPFALAVAGASGHGKSVLVRRLTGTDPDRLPEERRLGRTTDLGFAALVLPDGRPLGVIDLPGHERGRRHAAAGAAAASLALLTAACDRGIEPGTREALELLELLEIRPAAVALTRPEAASPEARARLREEMRALLAPRGAWREAPILEIPSDEAGAATLRELLGKLLAGAEPRDPGGPFRMPILRAFPAPSGTGVVVTGVPAAGRARVGDDVEILPGGIRARVAEVQAYRRTIPEARAGHLAALLLPDVPFSDAFHRGAWAAAPGCFVPASMIGARVRLRAALPPAGPDPSLAVVVHAGPAEAPGRAVPLSDPERGEEPAVWVQFRLEEPLPVVPGDRVVARRGGGFLGGGVVVEAGERRRRRGRPEDLRALAAAAEALGRGGEGSLETILRRQGTRPATLAELAGRVGLGESALETRLGALAEAGRAARLHDGRWVHPEALAEARRDVLAAVERFHRRYPQRVGPALEALLAEFPLDEGLFWTAAAALVREGALVTERGKVRRPDFSPELSAQDRHLLRQIEDALAEWGFCLPARADLYRRFLGRARPDHLERLLALLEDRGRVTPVGEGFLLHETVLDRARKLVGNALAREGPLETPRLKEILGVSRRYALPILERLDATGFTERVGNARVLRTPSAAPPPS